MYSLKEMIDLTSFKNIMRYLMTDPRITGIVIVEDESLELEEVAALMESPNKEDHAAFIQLHKDGKIRVTNNPGFPLDQAVYCIRLEPLYLIKDAKKLYV